MNEVAKVQQIKRTDLIAKFTVVLREEAEGYSAQVVESRLHQPREKP